MKISIVIAAYNADSFIERCLRSCLDQSIPSHEYEIIVVDDGSCDNTAKILANYIDDIKIIQNESNMGLPYSANAGIQAAKAQYVVRVDSDDYIHKEFLNIGYLFLSLNHDFDSVCVDYYLVDEKGNIIQRKNSAQEPIACGIFYRKEYLVNVGLYDSKFLIHEDKEFRIRFDKKYKIERIPLPLYRYRMHDNNITKKAYESAYYESMLQKKHFK